MKFPDNTIWEHLLSHKTDGSSGNFSVRSITFPLFAHCLLRGDRNEGRMEMGGVNAPIHHLHSTNLLCGWLFG
jgi:hypothetical protein